MKRQQSLVEVNGSMSAADREAIKAMISQHRFFIDHFVNNIAEGDLDSGGRLVDRSDFNEYVNSVVSRLAVRKYDCGKFIINMHDEGDEMFIVNDGSRGDNSKALLVCMWRNPLWPWKRRRLN